MYLFTKAKLAFRQAILNHQTPENSQHKLNVNRAFDLVSMGSGRQVILYQVIMPCQYMAQSSIHSFRMQMPLGFPIHIHIRIHTFMLACVCVFVRLGSSKIYRD